LVKEKGELTKRRKKRTLELGERGRESKTREERRRGNQNTFGSFPKTPRICLEIPAQLAC
jgi:hypothetical protein